MTGFFRRWGRGMKLYAGSALGVVESQLIVSFFISFGCMLGAWQRHLWGDGTVAFILFAIGLLQGLAAWQSFKSWRKLKVQDKLFRELEVKENE